MSEFLGARISLISRSDIRYVGTLHEINSDESTVSLENVRSFGTEGRKGKPDEEVAPSEQVYEYIVFRGTDVKDLRIEESPVAVKENNPPAFPSDPSIIGARPRPDKAPPGPSGPSGPPGTLGPPGLLGHHGLPNQQGPVPSGLGFGYFPPHMGGWGRGNGHPGPNAFGGMSHYPPAPWFPPQGQGFSPMGPGGLGPWGNYPFQHGPGGPPGAPGENSRDDINDPVLNNQAPQGKPTPIGAATNNFKKPATPAHAIATPVAPKHFTQAPLQSAASTAPPPPVESKPTAEEVKTTSESLATNAPEAPILGPSMAVQANSKQVRSGQIQPAVPLPPALTSRAAVPAPASASRSTTDGSNANVTLREATQAAKAAVAVAMAKLEGLQGGAQANGTAVGQLAKKVSEMRINSAPRGGAPSRGAGRGRGLVPGRSAKVEVPDADFDFATANAKFNKQDVVKEAIAATPLGEDSNGASAETDVRPTDPGNTTEPAYSKSKSFFDNISSEAKDRAESGQKPGGREWRGEEQRRNMETFGQGSVDGGYRGYRGRARGRGRGRGYGRGGRSQGQQEHRPQGIPQAEF